MVKNPSCNAGDKGSIPGLGTRIPHAAAQLNVHTAKKPNSDQKKKKREPSGHHATTCIRKKNITCLHSHKISRKIHRKQFLQTRTIAGQKEVTFLLKKKKKNSCTICNLH